MELELSKIIIGAMRFKDSKTATEVIRKAIDLGSNYIDTSPLYRFQNEEQNSEVWIGQAVNHKDYRNRTLISTKSAVTNGALGLGEFQQSIGFGAKTKDQFKIVFEQSLERLNLPYVDFYHLWICHTKEQFKEAFKPDGWYEGFLNEKASGRIKHFGLTSHGDSDTIIEFLETGYFETLTIPLNVLNITRLDVVEYCKKKNIKVIAMNPLGGGFLAADKYLKELAFKFLFSLSNVHLLIGFNAVEEVEYAYKMLDDFNSNPLTTEEILNKVNELLPLSEPYCTGCGYCKPCPKFIEVGTALSLYNFYKYLKSENAKTAFKELQWNPRYKLDQCIACGECEKRCPNSLKVVSIINDAKKIMYS